MALLRTARPFADFNALMPIIATFRYALIFFRSFVAA